MHDIEEGNSGSGERLTINLKPRRPIPGGHDNQGNGDAESDLSAPKLMGDDEFASQNSLEEARPITELKLKRRMSERIADLTES